MAEKTLAQDESVYSPNTTQPSTQQPIPENIALTPVLGATIVEAEQPLKEPTRTTVSQSDVVSPTDIPLGSTSNYYGETAPLVSSWESQADKQAGIQFQKDVLTAKQTMVRNRQQMDLEGSQAQTQLALGDYMRSQSAEKAGWTGGYMLDQKRQGDYLRASIQAQMYGAQELQRYGMETQLEAARLAFDLGKEQLAYQLYQQEYQKSITEAQMFGYYISPEIKDMFNQLRTANSILSDANATDVEKERANNLVTQINAWFGEQNLDPNDIRRFSEITMEREQWNQAKLDAVLASINDDPSIFLSRNDDGTYATDPATGQYVKLNFEDITSEDLLEFLSKDDQATNKFADQTMRSYAKYLAQLTLNNYFSTLVDDEVPTAEGLNEYLETQGSDRLKTYLNSLSPEAREEVEALLEDNFNPSLTRNGVTISYDNTVSGTGTSTETGTQTPSNIYTTEWYTENGITDFAEHVSSRSYTKLKTITYKDTNGNTQTRYIFNDELLNKNEVGFINGKNSFTYNLKFTDWIGKNDQYFQDLQDNNNWDNNDFAGVNKNLKMSVNLSNGSKEILDFEFGSPVASYFGIFGAFVYNDDLTYREIGKDGKASSGITNLNTIIQNMKVGEIKPYEVQYGNVKRKYMLVKDPKGNLRVLEVQGGGRDNMKKMLEYMGITNTGFQFT
jgi:hypothetical protein